MSKPFNIHDWQANQAKQRLAKGKLFEEDFKNPILDKYLELKKSIDYKTVFPTDLQSFLDSLDNTERKGLKRDLRDKEENPVVAKGDGLEITQDEMDKLHRDGRVRLKDGSLLVFPSKPLKVKEEDLNESLNPEVSKMVNRFIKGMAKKYDYSEQDAIFAIMAALKQRNMDEASMTGTGASFNAGSGEGYMSPNAFGDDKKKKMKTYKSIGYKKV